MMEPTTYSEAAGERDVAAFLAARADQLNLWKLPIKVWVARQGGAIVAALTLNAGDYLSVTLISADPAQRAFMRFARLWKLASTWLAANAVPIVCAPVRNTDRHFQSILRRLGFTKVGVEKSDAGEEVETIYAKSFSRGGVNADPVHA